MELMEPSDQLQIYNYTSGPDATYSTQTQSWNYTLAKASSTWLNWYQNSLGGWTPASPASTATSPPYVHVLADNIIFLAILPMLAPQNATVPSGGATDGTSTDIAPYYFYDTSQSIPSTSATRHPIL